MALISGAVTLMGVLASNSKSRAVTEQKIDEITRRVEKYNPASEAHVPAEARRGGPRDGMLSPVMAEVGRRTEATDAPEIERGEGR